MWSLSSNILAHLVLDATATCQLVAVTDGDYDGRLKEKGIPSLERRNSVGETDESNWKERSTFIEVENNAQIWIKHLCIL